jgi:hypothetical protein
VILSRLPIILPEVVNMEGEEQEIVSRSMGRTTPLAADTVYLRASASVGSMRSYDDETLSCKSVVCTYISEGREPRSGIARTNVNWRSSVERLVGRSDEMAAAKRKDCLRK